MLLHVKRNFLLIDDRVYAKIDVHVMQYTVFDQLKQRLLKDKAKTTEKGTSPVVLSAFSAFVLGALSKSIATVLTYPAIRLDLF